MGSFQFCYRMWKEKEVIVALLKKADIKMRYDACLLALVSCYYYNLFVLPVRFSNLA